jgi:hypothetical protein
MRTPYTADQIARARSIEETAWISYRKALQRSKTHPNAATKLRAIDEGERWQERNTDLHAMLCHNKLCGVDTPAA